MNTKRERLRSIGKLKVYEKKISERQVELDSAQNLEMEQIVDWINKNMVNTLETIFADGLDHGENIPNVLCDTWHKDAEDQF